MNTASQKPHAVCVPFPGQGHINPMLRVAKLLHCRGFYITFVNTESTHTNVLRSQGPDSLCLLSDFRFEAIPDGCLTNRNYSDPFQGFLDLFYSTARNCYLPFVDLLNRINNETSSDVPPVSCILADGSMGFALRAAQEFGVTDVILHPFSALSLICCMNHSEFQRRGLTALSEAAFNEKKDTVIDWIPGITRRMYLRNMATIIWSTDNDFIDHVKNEAKNTSRASVTIMNTFDSLEDEALNVITPILGKIYTIGPLQLLLNQEQGSELNAAIGSSLWREDPSCLEWLDSKQPGSVIYLNFGSTTLMTQEQIDEFAWGLANSKHNFLWIIRPDLVTAGGDLPNKILVEVGDRGMIASWCDQEKALKHSSVGGFLTHCGWNSVTESLGAGVPMICWPFTGDQQTNCLCVCSWWGIGIEIDRDVKREMVEWAVKEVLELGEKGKEMKKKAMEWKKKAEEAISPSGGSSGLNFEELVQLLLSPKNT